MRLVAWDRTDGLAPWWALGAKLISGAKASKGVASWDELVTWVERYQGQRLELQLWSHGMAGRPLLAARPPQEAVMGALLTALGPGSTVWWRSCEVHRGLTGKAFAKKVAAAGVHSLGHTHIISAPLPWQQKGLCGLKPGAEPWWKDDGKGLRACSVFRMTPPNWAWTA